MSSRFPHSLLPLNSTEVEHGLDSLAAEKLAMDLSNVDLHPQTCPAQLLPILAAQWRVDISGMTEAQKRNLITNALEIHRYKGTVYAVKKALGSVFSDSNIVEFDSRISPDLVFEFDAEVKTGTDATNVYQSEQFELARRLINTAKNARSRLRHFNVSLPEAKAEIVANVNATFSQRLASELNLQATTNLYVTTSATWELVFNE